jgi:hypothetical protein
VTGRADRPRLLAARSEVGYVDHPSLALPSQPEAVPLDYQHYLTDRASRRADERRREAWRESRELLQRGLDLPRGRPLGKELAGDLRVVQRQLERIDRRIGV